MRNTRWALLPDACGQLRGLAATCNGSNPQVEAMQRRPPAQPYPRCSHRRVPRAWVLSRTACAAEGFGPPSSDIAGHSRVDARHAGRTLSRHVFRRPLAGCFFARLGCGAVATSAFQHAANAAASALVDLP